MASALPGMASGLSGMTSGLPEMASGLAEIISAVVEIVSASLRIREIIFYWLVFRLMEQSVEGRDLVAFVAEK